MSDTATKERPIIFSGDMVRAILDGRKTQTRRVMKPQPTCGVDCGPGMEWLVDGCGVRCPYGQPRDHLWVRETVKAHELTDAEAEDAFVAAGGQPGGMVYPQYGLDVVEYKADGARIAIDSTPDAAEQWHELYTYGDRTGAWIPSIHMPRWASRITLEVTDVRVERVRDISEEDAMAEGCRGSAFGDGPNGAEGVLPTDEFRHLWDSINAKRGFRWDINPWVWVVTFRRIDDAE